MGISAALGSSALLPAGLGFRNLLMNGDMTLDQRGHGTALVQSSPYVMDRWQLRITSGGYLTAGKNYNGLTPPSGFRNYLGVKTTSAFFAMSSGSYFFLRQGIEGFNTAQLSWGTTGAKPVTLSFWINASMTGTYGGYLENASYNRSYVFTYTVNTANTWEKKIITIPGDTTGTWAIDHTLGVDVGFSLGVGTTYSGSAGVWTAGDLNNVTGGVSVVETLNATWNITGVQLEQNTQATPFEQRPYGVELALCQRYYEDSVLRVGMVGGALGLGGNTYFSSEFFKVTKRIAPTSLGGSSDTPGVIRVWDNNGTAGAVSLYSGGWTQGVTTVGYESYSANHFSPYTYSNITDAKYGSFRWAMSAEL